MAIAICPQCSAKNRVDEHQAEQMRPVCGRCGAPLDVKAPAAGQVMHLDDRIFAAAVRDAKDKPMLVDCWAQWCGPCRMLGPTIDELGRQAAGRWIIAKLNVDENPQTAGQYRIESIPTMLLFKNGQLVDRMVGLQPRPVIEKRLMQLAAG